MNTYDWRGIAQLFHLSLFKRLTENGDLDNLRSVLKYTPITQLGQGLSVGEVIDILYQLLVTHYRSEYVYKNTLAQKIKLERHLEKQSRLITELRINKSKADTVVINGTSTVYEIKTELDSLNRLPGQLADYAKVFDKLYVVTYPDGIKRVLEATSSNIGVIALNDHLELDVLREASTNLHAIEPLAIFDALRRSEYLEILSRTRRYTPPANAFEVYRHARAEFAKLDAEEAHAEMVRILKNRTKCLSQMNFVSKLPPSLRSLGLSSELSRKHHELILNRIAQPIIL